MNNLAPLCCAKVKVPSSHAPDYHPDKLTVESIIVWVKVGVVQSLQMRKLSQ